MPNPTWTKKKPSMRIKDRDFTSFIDEAELDAIVRRLAAEVSRDYAGGDLVACPVLTGAYMFAADLLRRLTVPCEVRFVKSGPAYEWESAENPFVYNDNMRLIGLADMAAGIERGRPHRCSGELAYHVTDVMCSILESAEKRQTVTLESACERPAPLREGLAPGELD